MSEHLESKIAESSPAPGMLRSALRWFLAMGILARLALLASTVGVVGGVAYRIESSAQASGPEPAVGLYWQANVDPTIAPGVAAPLWQLLWRTDAPSIYFKSGAATTAWVKVGNGTSSGGTITGGGTAPDLAVWSGATAIGNYAGSSPTACAANNALSRVTIDAAGALAFTCVSVTPGGSISGTAGDLAVFTGAGATVGNYAGSSPTACTAGNVVTGSALSAAGALTQTCTAIGTAGGLTGSLTSGKIPRATGTTSLGDGSFADTGTDVSTSSTVELNGAATVSQLNYTSQSSTITGTNNDVALNATATIFYWAGASAGTISGFTGGVANRNLVVINNSKTQILTLSTLSGSSAGNQLQNLGPTTTNLRLVGSEGSSARYIYVGAAGSGVWQLVSFSSSTIDASLTFGNSVNGTTFQASSSLTANGRNVHFRAIVDTPSATTCGTSPTVTSTDAGGEVTIGTTSGGNCTVTFNTTYTQAPACIVRFHDATTNNAISYSTTATTLAITGASDGKVFDFFCLGHV
jgi:hypothetical protein